jgi:hypothetical protein
MTARASLTPLAYIYDGRACLGFVLSRGRAGFEAFDRAWKRAISTGGVPIEIGRLRPRTLVDAS